MVGIESVSVGLPGPLGKDELSSDSKAGPSAIYCFLNAVASCKHLPTVSTASP